MRFIIFQSPFNRDSNCNCAVAVAVLLAENFQSPFNRDSNCNYSRTFWVHTFMQPFSPLLIGIAIVTLIRSGIQGWAAFFQSPFNRDSNCNKRKRQIGIGSHSFQSPFNRDSNCNGALPCGSVIPPHTFSPLLIGIAIVTFQQIIDTGVLETFSPLLIGIAIVTDHRQHSWIAPK